MVKTNDSVVVSRSSNTKLQTLVLKPHSVSGVRVSVAFTFRPSIVSYGREETSMVSEFLFPQKQCFQVDRRTFNKFLK